jgi:hypothetical protein
MPHYPESLIERSKYVEKVNDNLREIILRNEEYIESLRENYKLLSEVVSKEGHYERLWVFQNDGYDNLNSMVGDLPVLIKAADLRNLIKNGELICEE